MNDHHARFRTFIEKRTGLALDADREYMVEARLAPLQRTLGVKNLVDMLETAMNGADPALSRAVTEAMLTGETFFFRDRQVFQSIRETILPEILNARRDVRHLRIWCAACSTGQEPYSVAMILDEEARNLRGWRIEIIATDVAGGALEIARDGLYNQFEVQRGLPVALLLRYFSRQGDRWRLAEHLRTMVDFRQLNLISDPCPPGQFDIIFCRNVLMYFATPVKQAILSKVSDVLVDDGWLLLGATENTSGLESRLEASLQIPGSFRPRPYALPDAARAGRRAQA